MRKAKVDRHRCESIVEFADLGESPIFRMHAEAFERPNLSDITIEKRRQRERESRRGKRKTGEGISRGIGRAHSSGPYL